MVLGGARWCSVKAAKHEDAPGTLVPFGKVPSDPSPRFLTARIRPELHFRMHYHIRIQSLLREAPPKKKCREGQMRGSQHQGLRLRFKFKEAYQRAGIQTRKFASYYHAVAVTVIVEAKFECLFFSQHHPVNPGGSVFQNFDISPARHVACA